MHPRELIQTRREEILQIAARHGASNVRIFGSVARNDARDDSDIDLLVDMEPGRTLLDRSELLQDLRDLLGRNVEVLTEPSIYWLIRRRIMKEAQPL